MYSIIIVDDEWTVREGLKRTVPWDEIGCYVVADADCGESALQLVKQYEPDVLLTDVRMPGMDGLELAERALQLCPLTKVIILSGYDDFAYVQGALSLGVTGYVLKPTNVDELLDVVRRALTQLEADAVDERGRQLAIEKVLLDHMRQPVSGEHLSTLQALLGDTLLSHFERFLLMLLEWGTSVPAGESANREGVFTVQMSERRMALVVPCQDPGLETTALREIVMQQGFVTEPTIMGVSGVHRGLAALPNALHEAEIALQQRRISGFAETNIVQFERIGWQGTLTQHDMAAILEQIKRSFTGNISLQGLARQFHLSESQLSRHFRKHTGMHFSEFVTQQRIALAKQLLHTPGIKVYEVAEAVGYADARYFSQVFRRHTGMTPTDYQRQVAMSESPQL